MGRNVKQERKEEQIESVNAAFEGSKDEAILRNFPSVVPRFVLGLERRDARDGENPIEEAIEGHEVVGRVVHPEGGDGGPGEEGGGGDGDADEEEALEGDHDGRVLDEDPLELEGGPDADEEVGVGAEEGGEDGDGDGGVEGGEEGGGEEEG